VLAAFRNGEVRTLVATDIAARGIDVDGISHVVNYDLPNVPETYVHRIGRTARAGAAGVAISLCDGEEVAFLRDIEKLIRLSIPLSDRRADPRRPEPAPAKHAAARPPSHGKDRHWHQDNSHKKGRRHQAGDAGIESVAFLQRNGSPPRRDREQRPARWTGQSKGS
jgi:superfamily II DNA/RNA helicase